MWVRSVSVRSPGEGDGSPLQYSCLENPIGRGPWQATVKEVAKSQTRLSDSAHFTARAGNMLISSLSPPQLLGQYPKKVGSKYLSEKKKQVNCHFLEDSNETTFVLILLFKILDKVVKIVAHRIFSIFMEAIDMETRTVQTIMKDIS